MQKGFKKQMSLESFKEKYQVYGTVRIHASTKKEGAFWAMYETPKGTFTMAASNKFSDAEYLKNALTRGLAVGQTEDDSWIVFAKGAALETIMEM